MQKIRKIISICFLSLFVIFLYACSNEFGNVNWNINNNLDDSNILINASVNFYVDDVVLYNKTYAFKKLEGFSIIKPSTPSKINHDFIYWQTLDNKEFDFTKRQYSNINLYAKFENIAINRTVRYFVDNIEVNVQNYNFNPREGFNIKLPSNPVKENYDFLYWENSFGVEYKPGKKEFNNINLYAKFELNTTKITVRFYIGNQIHASIGYEYYSNHGVNIYPITGRSSQTEAFMYWATKSGQRYNFNTTEYEDLDLYAVREFSTSITNTTIMNRYIKANVEINTRSYDTFWFIDYNEVRSRGSGVIFHDQGDSYFVLTNNHVVDSSGRKNVDYRIVDSSGNSYTGYLQQNSTKKHYDLAVLYFRKTRVLEVLPLTSTNPLIGSRVIVLGQPLGQRNVITHGVVRSYETIFMPDYLEVIDVNFPVLNHSAATDSGSSGGVVMNTSFQIVGISFAGGRTTNGQPNGRSYAIPIEKVNEYLNIYIYSRNRLSFSELRALVFA